MKVAIVHDWLTGMRGGEKCLEVFCELFPDATLFTLLHDKGRLSEPIERMDIKTSFIQKLPFVKKKYRNYLPLFPAAIEQFDLKSFDLILSSSHCVAKGVIPHPESYHICYCYTPMRYVWDLYQEYLRDKSWLTKKIAPYISNYLRLWDVASSSRVDYFVAISNHVRQRIARYYRRDAEVIYPPVDTELFKPSSSVDEYYLIVSAFVPYKKLDIAILAFNQLGYPLKVIGTGPDEKRLKAIVRSRKIEFLGWQSQRSLGDYYSRCKALIFPGEEDFGITVLEAQASGRPVIAYGKGGVLETVIPYNPPLPPFNKGGGGGITEDSPTGIFFYEQTPKALISAIRFFEKTIDFFDSTKIRGHVMAFDKGIFKERIKRFIEERHEDFLREGNLYKEQVYVKEA
jgi:glycosyltransferase involved in cell wall biosynthesis